MRLVIKVGTSTLSHENGQMNLKRTEKLCRTISDLQNAGHQCVLVSSGAIGMGVSKLRLPGRPKDMPGKQAAAAVGQCELMFVYDKLFGEYGQAVAQVLLTAEDVADDRRRYHVENALEQLLSWGVLPIINENDAVAVDEIGIHTTIGENDSLSAIVACMIKAELLVLLSDIDGLYTADPRVDERAVLLETVAELTPEIMALGGGAGSNLGTGGMATKLKAADMAVKAGIDMVITNGEYPEKLYDLLEGKSVGTRFLGKKG